MTAQEHALMIALLAVQIESNRALADVLKSRGILDDDDDLRAFALSRPLEAQKDSVDTAHQMYSSLAKVCGIRSQFGMGNYPSRDRQLPTGNTNRHRHRNEHGMATD